MITTKISITSGRTEQRIVALNEAYIISIQDRSDDRDDYWKSKIKMSDGSEYLCLEPMASLLKKIEGEK